MSWATMNGINQTRAAVSGGRAPASGGMQSSVRPPVQGMMGTSPNDAPGVAADFVPRGSQQSAQGVGGPTAVRLNPNNGVRVPFANAQPQLPPPPAAPQFDPNDPRNAALIGYMNRG